MNELPSRRELLGGSLLPASFAVVAALDPTLPTEAGDVYVRAVWHDDYEFPGHHLLAVGPTPLDPVHACRGSIEGLLFQQGRRGDRWTFRVGVEFHHFTAANLGNAKKLAEQRLVEVVRRCLVELEKVAFSLRGTA